MCINAQNVVSYLKPRHLPKNALNAAAAYSFTKRERQESQRDAAAPAAVHAAEAVLIELRQR